MTSTRRSTRQTTTSCSKDKSTTSTRRSTSMEGEVGRRVLYIHQESGLPQLLLLQNQSHHPHWLATCSGSRSQSTRKSGGATEERWSLSYRRDGDQCLYQPGLGYDRNRIIRPEQELEPEFRFGITGTGLIFRKIRFLLIGTEEH